MRIIINGAQGKMGKMASEALSQEADFTIVGLLGRADNLAKVIQAEKADIVLDLSTAEAVYANTRCILEQGARPVIGTSGLQATEVKALQDYAKQQQVPGIIVPNFSLSAVLMMRFASMAASYLNDCEIIEAHHAQKLDAPSGTAIKTAELIASARKHQRPALALKEILPGARGASLESIPIHSIRLPGILAQQEVLFGSQGETLSIKQQSIDRACYKPGLILACRRVSQLSALVYGLEHILF